MPVFEAARALPGVCGTPCAACSGYTIASCSWQPTQPPLRYVSPSARLGPPGFPSPLGGALPPPPPGLLLPPSVHIHIMDIMHKTRGALQPEDFDPLPPQMRVRAEE